MAEKRDSRVLKSAAWHPAFNEKHEDHIPNKLADIRYFICLSQLFSLSFSSHGLSIMIITLWSGDPWHIVWGRVTLCHAVTLYLLWHNNNQICHNLTTKITHPEQGSSFLGLKMSFSRKRKEQEIKMAHCNPMSCHSFLDLKKWRTQLSTSLNCQ